MAEPDRPESWFEHVEGWAETLAAILGMAAAAIVVLGIVLRELFKISPSWIVEAPSYAIVWGIFLMLAATFRRGLHLGLDLLVVKLPLRVQHAFAIFGSVAVAGIAAVLFWIGSDLTLRQYAIGAVSNTALRMPLYLVSAAIPTGCALLFIRAIWDIVVRLRNGPAAPPIDAPVEIA